ncbi:hypothetical protein CACET_c35500 [Clostridium aceticum]|uniref:Uncharacterized protein n=1 Tax=Clostridium aceticum TaxID=84022 RepID=A0A0G3WED3_9CLOT|nr:hypothetical protein CACET_c35500 [Clostridium aceticum]
MKKKQMNGSSYYEHRLGLKLIYITLAVLVTENRK